MPDATPTIRELAAWPAAETYKADARSTVWRVERGRQAFVLKRYEYFSLRQRLGRWLGLHPGQREDRGIDRLERAGLPVVAVESQGLVDGRFVQATRWQGESLQSWLGRVDGGDAAPRRLVLDRVAEVAARLLAAGLVHRDFKASNVLVRDDRTVALIDVGAVRPSRSRRRQRATLFMLCLTLRKAGASVAEVEAVGAALRSQGVSAGLVPDASGLGVDSDDE